MMEDFRFSVLIPVYIKEDIVFFKEAIESILHQTLLPDEIVIVEDGPLSDEMYTLLSKYKNDHPLLFQRVVLPVNMGMGKAMNEGLNHCRYKWVARMDSDDIARPYRFEKQINYLKNHPEVDALGALIEEFKAVPGDLGLIRQLPEKHDEITVYCRNRSPVNHMTIVYKKECAQLAGGYWDKKILEDYNLWYQMIKRGYKFANLQEVLMDARVGNNMIGRRHGIGYLKAEYGFFRQMKADNFITSAVFIRNIMYRIFLRTMPKRVLQLIYFRFLRERKSV
ncbi:glycosyltransferase [Chitinophaga sp. SYP-B3965]|uniref:glycosyltransferase n=1 Tax=Chitinophaga sp. SYP-B3965 TaxID=2663120 RepID=UPI0012997F5C|nr:glycosyltransferase [Chitinophaga sp. SYP-B3965]MRG46914.1 glycosyltransferase [Chitinophaga sp. SYP-B3965]